MGNFCIMWARIQEKGRKLTQNYSFTAQIINVLLKFYVSALTEIRASHFCF